MQRSSFQLIFPLASQRRLAFVVCVGLSSGIVSSAFGQTATQFTTLNMEVPPATKTAVLKGHANPTQPVHLAITLQFPNPGAVQAFVDSVSNPKSASYGQFITPQEFGQKFGQPAAKVQAVVNYLTSQGLKIKLTGANNLSILADGTVAQAEKAFNTTINKYHSNNPKEPGRIDFYANAEPLMLPNTLTPYVLNVSGVENYTKPFPRALTPTQTRTLYNLDPIFSGGMHGEGRSVAISSFDGFLLSNVPKFYTQFNLPTPAGGVLNNVTVKAIDGGSGSGTPAGEADLDIQMVLGMAPLCNFTIYDGGSGLINVLTAEANDNTADIISESYGWNIDASTATAAHNLHMQMNAQGITYMEATGDNGTSIEPFSYSNYEPEVLQVGGTIATVDISGHRNTEVGWSGSGGGWSTKAVPFNTRPSWQTGSGVPNFNFRLNPDISLHAAGQGTGAYQFFFNGTLSSDFDGTSFACPVFAGMLADAEQKIIARGGLPANSAGKRRFGRIQDLFYSQAMRSDIYFDVVSGANGTLPNGDASTAKAGWDFVTGLGVIDMNAFANSIVVIPPIQVNPLNAAIFQSWGTAASGDAAKLTKTDALYYTESSVPQTTVGAVAAAQIKFNLSGDLTKLTSLSGTIVANGLSTCTNYIYALNTKTGLYDLLNTSPLKTTNSTISFNIPNWKNYVSASNQVTIVERAINPTRFGGARFTLKMDQAILQESF